MSFSDSDEQDEIIDVSAEYRSQKMKSIKNVCQSIKLFVDTITESAQCCIFIVEAEMRKLNILFNKLKFLEL